VGAKVRVVVGDAGFSVERVDELLDGLGVEVVRGGEPWGSEDVVALLVGTDVRVVEADLDRLPALRVVATCSVGFDHVAFEEAGRRGVWVCNVPDYCVEEVADHSLALVLALLRGVVELDRDVRAGRWDCTAAGPLRRIRGTRLGVVGFGRTGRALAERAQALGFEVWAADPAVPEEAIAAAARLVKAAGYYGLITVEFRRDSRDQRLILIKTDPRFTRATSLSTALGMDTPTALYRLAVDGKIEARQTYPEGVAWLWETAYLEAVWNNRDDRPLRQELLALGRSVRRIKAFAYLSFQDPLPFLMQAQWRARAWTWERVRGVVRRCAKAVGRWRARRAMSALDG